jgi:ERF superfamily
MGNEITVQKSNPSALIEMALEKQASIETLERLFNLQKDWEANEARKAFVAAMANFKSEPMVIAKNKLVSFTTSKGTTQYYHAELPEVVAVVVPNMSKHGLSHRWSVNQNAMDITVDCIITHAQGHSESVSMTARPDDSGGKNAIQSIGSAVSYLQRYTLLAATGMATGGDTDGIAPAHEESSEQIEAAKAIYEAGKAAAKQGSESLKEWYRTTLTEAERGIAYPMMAELKEAAKAGQEIVVEVSNEQ